MAIDREARERARNPNYRKAPESTVQPLETETLPEPLVQDNDCVTVGKSGTRIRSKAEMRGEKFKEARELLERLSREALQRPKSTRCADREWFEKNRMSVQCMVPYGVGLDKPKTK